MRDPMCDRLFRRLCGGEETTKFVEEQRHQSSSHLRQKFFSVCQYIPFIPCALGMSSEATMATCSYGRETNKRRRRLHVECDCRRIQEGHSSPTLTSSSAPTTNDNTCNVVTVLIKDVSSLLRTSTTRALERNSRNTMKKKISLARRRPGLASFGRLLHTSIVFSLLVPFAAVAAFLTTTTRYRQRCKRSSNSSSLFLHRNGHETKSSSSSSSSSLRVVPRHVALICDGNSRWAAARGLPAAAGHAAGADRLVQVLTGLQDAGVAYCTLFCFSTENWQRPAAEIADLMTVMEQTARRFRRQIQSSGTRVRILGDLQDARIPAGLREILTQMENESCRNDDDDDDDCGDDTRRQSRQTVSLAINYGGRQDILNAVKLLAKDAASMTTATARDSGYIDSLTEDDLASYLGTHGLPDPDLVIRTSGEHRLSNFLLWNVAYAEMYFTDILWPDFDAECVTQALEWYSNRQRRFGARTKLSSSSSPPTSSSSSILNGASPS